MIINVTQDHINRGVRFDPNSCPVSLAMKEKGFLNVDVSSSIINYIDEFDTLFTIVNDDSLCYWIQTFDNSQSNLDLIYPFQFEINITDYQMGNSRIVSIKNAKESIDS